MRWMQEQSVDSTEVLSNLQPSSLHDLDYVGMYGHELLNFTSKKGRQRGLSNRNITLSASVELADYMLDTSSKY